MNQLQCIRNPNEKIIDRHCRNATLAVPSEIERKESKRTSPKIDALLDDL